MLIEKVGKLMFTLADLEPIVKLDGIVDGTVGGLVLGASHSEGGIKVLKQYHNQQLYEVFAEIEGYEYLLNPLVTIKEMEYLRKLNLEFVDTKEEFIKYEIPRGIEIIDTKKFLSVRRSLINIFY